MAFMKRGLPAYTFFRLQTHGIRYYRPSLASVSTVGQRDERLSIVDIP